MNQSSSRILGLTTATAIALVVSANPVEASDRRLTQRIESSTYALGQFTLNPSQRIPPELVQKAEGIAIIPNVVQAGFLFGGRRGAGILMVRNEEGQWSHPVFITLTGGSFGLQIGAQSSDVVLVFMDKATIMRSLHQSFRLGGNVSVAAGPVGGDAVNPTDPNPQVYSYTRSSGLFAGVALEGAKIDFDASSSNTFYEQRNLTPTQIFANDPELPNPPVLNGLNNTLQRAAR